MDEEEAFDELKEYERLSTIARAYPNYWQAMFFFGDESPLVARDRLLLFNLSCFVNDHLAYILCDIMNEHYISINHQQAVEFLNSVIAVDE